MLQVLDAGLTLFDERAALLDDAAGALPDAWSGADIEALRAGIERVRQGALQGEAGRADFLHLAHVGSSVQPEAGLARIRAWADGLVERGVKDVLWIGLGGSGLGPRLLVDALGGRSSGRDNPRPTVRIVDTLSPDDFAGLLAELDPWRTHVVLASKSGSTAETVMLGGWALQWFEAAGTALDQALTIVGGPEAGALARLAERVGTEPFLVPLGIGGRWSVLSPIGLLAAAAIGVDLDELLAGAAAVDADYLAGGALVTRWAELLMRALASDRRTVPIVVYDRRLERLGDWAQQLLMESLGKRFDRDGNEIRHGLTVIAARGTADQHSMLQEWLEGPRDKYCAFVIPRRSTAGPTLPPGLDDDVGLISLAGRTPREVQLALYQGTADALAASGVPSSTLVVEQLDARGVGGLVFSLELACALIGEGLDINAYDQPGVEDGKGRARHILLEMAQDDHEPAPELRFLMGED